MINSLKLFSLAIIEALTSLYSLKPFPLNVQNILTKCLAFSSIVVLMVETCIYSFSLKNKPLQLKRQLKQSKIESLMRSYHVRVDSDSPRVNLSFCSNSMGRLDLVALILAFCIFLFGSTPGLFRSTQALH